MTMKTADLPTLPAGLRKCDSCGCSDLMIDAVVYGTDHVRLNADDPWGYEVYQHSTYDSEWADDGSVTCSGCRKSWPLTAVPNA